MTQVKIISLFGLLLASVVVAELKCGPNELREDCAADCASDHCPKSEVEAKSSSCAQPKKCPAPACKCQFDYSRAENGTCIPTRKCPSFKCSRPNEEYRPCPPACSDDCSQATLSGDCPPTFGLILIVIPCSPSCRCVHGYWRKDGTCVPYAQCPNQ